MPIIAFYTFGILNQPYGHPQVQEFYDKIDAVFSQAKESEGLIEINSELAGREAALPRFYDREKDPEAPSTLSCWKDLESVFAFAYKGLHGAALRKRHEWFRKGDWPTYVAWWISDDHIPTAKEAVHRLEHLHDNGSTPFAFNFKKPFDAYGNPVQPDAVKIKRNIQKNECGSHLP
ncbi:MAG: DUF3291 domain-containing protein [Ignavibacteria bacterium]|nr:DUF3291 domain-containing protein [Ignavibacteria bacterium]